MRWEGNEGEVKAFDHVMQSSVRPALITNFAPVARSPSAVTSPTSSLASSGLSHGVGGVRIVGDMIFDPVRMSWHPVNPSAAAAEDDFDFGDDEADAALGAAAESETGRLKPKASFFALSATSDTPGADGTPAERAFWAECVAAETRHAEEMRPWSHRRTLLNAADPHAYLYDIRKVRRRATVEDSLIRRRSSLAPSSLRVRIVHCSHIAVHHDRPLRLGSASARQFPGMSRPAVRLPAFAEAFFADLLCATSAQRR